MKKSSFFIIDMKKNQSLLYNEVRGKSGVYLLYNFINGKFYIGSSVDLYNRMRAYYLVDSNRPSDCTRTIDKAIVKYGLENFGFLLLDVCEPSQILELEQLALDFFNPSYNILTVAGNSSGFKHSEATKALLSKNLSRENHPMFGKNHSEATKNKISEGLNEYFKVNTNKYIGVTGQNSPQYGIGGTVVYVYDSTTGVFIQQFVSISEAQKFLKVRFSTIKSSLDGKTIIKGKYIVSDVFHNMIDTSAVVPILTDNNKKRISPVFVYDAFTYAFIIEYPSIRSAAIGLKASQSTVSNCLKTGVILQSKWFVSSEGNSLYHKTSIIFRLSFLFLTFTLAPRLVKSSYLIFFNNQSIIFLYAGKP
uniref:GIY endonuclease n=1 Tax=Blastocladiella sp. TaxID=2169676 RepID=A0A890JI39_9FUNG|nr:GIY endonuclease [Blastocladiella sp.]